jgi:PAS domain S-box-containing protein
MNDESGAPAAAIDDNPRAIVSVLLIEGNLRDEMALTRGVVANTLPYQMTIARSVADARQVLSTRSFDIILTGYHFPDGTSLDLIEEFSGHVVIFITDSDDENVISRELHPGAHRYLVKDQQHDYLKLLPYYVETPQLLALELRATLASEAQLRDLFDGTSNLIQSIAPDGSILFVNHAWRETLGYSEEEVVALNLFDIIHPDHHEHCSALFQRLMAGEDVGLVEVSFRAKDGEIIAVEGDVTMRFEGGKAVASRGIFRDVTRKLAEESLRVSDASFQADFLNPVVGVVQVDPRNGQFLRSNKRYQEIAGYTGVELRAMKFSELTHPDDRKRDWESFSSAAHGVKKVYHTEKRYIRKDGSIVWVRLSVAFIRNIAGQPIGTIAVCTDISEYKQAEAREY